MTKRAKRVLVYVLLCCVLASPDALAQETTQPTESVELRNTQWWFLTSEFVASIALGFVVPDLFFPNRPATPTCENSWCETNGFDAALQNALAVKSRAAAPLGTISHIFTIGFVPALAFAGGIVGSVQDGRAGPALQDIAIITNSFLIATGFNSLAKVGARRQRPAFHYDREANTEAASHPDEEFVSFYSGDTTWAFALAASGSTLAILRRRSWAKPFTIGLGALALTGGVLRVVSDMHWTTDMLVGAATGTAVGVALPLLLHGRKSRAISVLPSLNGPGAQVSYTW